MSLTRQQQKDLVTQNFPSNGRGEINAKMQRDVLSQLIDGSLQPEDLVQTWTGNEALKPISAAGAKALYDALVIFANTAAAQVKSDLLNGAPAAYDTLLEIATQLGNDEALATILTNRVATLETAILLGGPTFITNIPFSLGATGSYPLGTTKNTTGMYFVPQDVCLIVRAFTGTLVTAATVTIGTNSPAYDNIASRQLAGITSTSIGLYIPVSFNAFELTPNTPLFANVKSAQVGGTATVDVFMQGLYRQR